MGKSKGSQRTKGNAKPSSSGHSAELLGSTGQLSFIGFSNSKVSQHVAQNSDNSVDGAFTMVMKKMLKRDTTTKLKAVQEFRDLCVEKEKDDVLAVMAFWPRLYNRLALDCDRRIREATQEANAKLIEKVSRDIAPFLKNMMGVWLLSQSDLYPPAASVAHHAFTSTFPQEKQSDALMFCKEEIILFSKENLFELTIQSLKEPSMPDEEVEQKYVLLVAGTLQGLKLLISTISSEAKEKFKDDIQSIISQNKFWKLAKHKNIQIRVSWYNLVSSLCRDLPQVFDTYESKLGSAILGCLSESDPVIAAAVWEAALNFVAGFEDCWKNLDVNKVVLPELWTVLKEGGRGNAHLLYPCLLPFLSKLPIENIKQKENFFSRFFSSIVDSLFLDGVRKSTSECNAVITAFMECLHYLCFHLGKDQEFCKIAKELVRTLVFPLVKRSFSAEGSHLPVSKFYPLIGAFIQSLERGIAIEEGTDGLSDLFGDEVSHFWKGVFLISSDILNREHLTENAAPVFLAYFFHCMYEPSNMLEKTAKKTRIRFQDQTDETCQKEPSHKTDSSVSKSVHPPERTKLFSCTSEVALLICQELQKQLDPHYMKLLVEILTAARCSDIFQDILKKYSDTSCPTVEAPSFFFHSIIMPWIDRAEDSSFLQNSLVDIAVITCSCLDIEDSSKILDKCSKVSNVKFLERFLFRIIATNSEVGVFHKWLESFQPNRIIERLLQFVANSLSKKQRSHMLNLQPYLNTLSASFASLAKQELVIDPIYVGKFLSIIKASLEWTNISQSDWNHENTEVIEFLCDITQILLDMYESNSFDIVDDLMMIFLDYNLSQPSQLEGVIINKMHNIWLTSVKKLAIAQYDHNPENIFSTTISKLHELVVNPPGSIRQSCITACITDLLSAFESVFSVSDTTVASSVILSTIKRILPSDNEWLCIRKDLKLSLLPAFLERKLFAPLPAESVNLEICTEIPHHITVSQTVSDLLMNCLTLKELSQEESLLFPLITEQLPHLTWAFSYCETSGFLKKKDTDMYQIAYKLQKNCFKILSFLPEEETKCLITLFSELASRDPSQWLFPFENTVGIVKTRHSIEMSFLYDLYFQLSDNKNIGQQLSSQMLLHQLPTSEKIDLTISHILQNTLNNQSYVTICCCLQESGVLDSKDIRTDLPELLKKVFLAISSKDLSVKDVALYSSQTCALINAVLSKDPEMLSSMWLPVFEFSSTTILRCQQQVMDSFVDAQKLICIHHCCTMVFNLLSQISDANPCFEKQLPSLQLWIKNISTSLVKILFAVSDNLKSLQSVPVVVTNFLSVLSAGIECISPEALLNCLLQLQPTEGRQSVQEATVNSMLKEKLLPLLTSNILPLQLSAHSILTKFLPLVAECLCCEDRFIVKDEDEKFIKLKSLVDSLESLTEVVESMLSDVRISEICVVVPDTDSYTYTMGFLFAWSEILDFFAALSNQERPDYVSYLENKKLLSKLLACVFRLLPEDASTLLREEKSTGLNYNLKSLFLQPPTLSSVDPPIAVDLQHLACNAFYSTLKRMPAAVRTWCHSLDKRSFEAVNKFTTKYISSLLASKELQAVQERNLQLTNMTVQACPGSREVTATYTVDNYGIELVIQLPTNYPLGALNIERRDNVKLNHLKWRHWLMQLTAFLTYQNGSILDGLLLWKKNLDKTFEGIEECLICFFTLHSTTYELPKTSCPTCRKKFHSTCIHKWFVTSNNATCPMCRNLW